MLADDYFHCLDLSSDPSLHSHQKLPQRSMIMTQQSPNQKDLERLKCNYAEMIVDGMDMDSLIVLAVESIEKNLEDWTWDEVTEEIVDHYGEDTLIDLLPEADNNESN